MNDPTPRPTYSRNESAAERLDRNYSELLQELRVAQTGVQILFAFLLTIPFQQRFNDIDAFQRTVYVVTLLCAAISALLLISPVSAHRVLFRRHRKDELVAFTGRVAAGGLIFLLAAMLGAVLLVVDWVANLSLALATVAGLGVIGMWFWWIQPVRWLAGTERLKPTDSAPDADVGPGETNGSR
jgi:O-antigen/teichoic acid export membrane protein